MGLTILGSTEVNHHFFDTAFQIYRKRYDKDDTKVIFLAVSDDTKWIKVKKREKLCLYLLTGHT